MATFNWHHNIAAHLLAVLRRWLVRIWVIRIEMVANARKRFGFNRCNRVVQVRVVIGVVFNRVVIAVVEIRVVDVLLWAPPTTAAATSLLGVRTCSRRKYVRCTRTCTYCIKLNQRCWKAAYKTDTCTSWHHLIHVHIPCTYICTYITYMFACDTPNSFEVSEIFEEHIAMVDETKHTAAKMSRWILVDLC